MIPTMCDNCKELIKTDTFFKIVVMRATHEPPRLNEGATGPTPRLDLCRKCMEGPVLYKCMNAIDEALKVKP